MGDFLDSPMLICMSIEMNILVCKQKMLEKPFLKAPAPHCTATSQWKVELGNTVLKGALWGARGTFNKVPLLLSMIAVCAGNMDAWRSPERKTEKWAKLSGWLAGFLSCARIYFCFVGLLLVIKNPQCCEYWQGKKIILARGPSLISVWVCKAIWMGITCMASLHDRSHYCAKQSPSSLSKSICKRESEVISI